MPPDLCAVRDNRRQITDRRRLLIAVMPGLAGAIAAITTNCSSNAGPPADPSFDKPCVRRHGDACFAATGAPISSKEFAMFRPSLLVAALVITLLASANGCQSCSSCHDYDCPVKGCQCQYAPQGGCTGGCSSCGCNSGGCSSCNAGTTEGSYYMQPGESSQPSSAEVEAAMPQPPGASGTQARHWNN